MSDWLTTLKPAAVVAATDKLRANHPDKIDRAGGDVRFALWLDLVDIHLIRATGISHTDLSDWTWRDAFDNGDSPKDAATEALHSDDMFAMFN